MENGIIARRLQEALRNSRMTATELSELSGVSKNSISQYVNGTHRPSNYSAQKMGRILEVNPLWLMGYEVSETPIDSMVLMFSRLDLLDKGKVSGYMQGLLDSDKYANSSEKIISVR